MSLHPLILGLEWPTAVPGGLNRYVGELHLALRGQLDAVDTIVLAPAPEIAGVHGLVVRSDSRVGRLWAYRRAVRRFGTAADVVDAHFALVAAPVLPWLRRSGRPLILHFHGPWADEAAASGRESGHRRRRAVERAVTRQARAVVCLSAAMARVAIETNHASPWKVRVLPPGVDRERFRPATASERHLLRTAQGLQDDDYVVVVARRLIPRTGVDLVVSAWPGIAERAAASGTRACLTVVGDGPELNALRAIAGDDVRFTGAVADAELAEWYRLADLSVVPSRALEGFGLVVLESLASGTPVVVTDIGGLPEAVAGLDGTSVVSASTDAIGERVAQLASRSVETTSVARCRAATKGRGWDDVAAAHVALYGRARELGSERRVVLLDHVARLSGGELAAARMTAALPDARVHAVLFEDGPFAAALGVAGATVEVRPLAPSVRDMNRADAGRARAMVSILATTAWFTARLAWRLRRLRPDVVHANSLKAGLIGGVAAKLARVPMVWHVRDRLAPDYLPSRAARVARAGVAHLADGVITPSDAVMATLGPVPRRGQVRRVVPDSAPDYGPNVRTPPGRPPAADPIHVVLVGRLAPWKGQRQFLEAFAAAFPVEGARASLVGEALFGEIEYRSTLERRRDELGLTERVVLAGHVTDVGAIYRTADIVVHASIVPEPFGQVVVEALAAGVPVIATDAGGPAEILTDDHDGLLVPPGDVPALADALRRLADDPQLRARLAGAGLERVAHYRAERIGPAVADVYQAVVDPKRSRR